MPETPTSDDARAQAEAWLRENATQRAFLRYFGDSLRAQPSEAAVANLAIRLLADELGADRCCIAELNLPADRADIPYQLFRSGQAPWPALLHPSQFPETLQRIYEGTQVVDDVASNGAFGAAERQTFAALGAGAFVVAPLFWGEGRPFWALVVVAAAARRFSPGEVRLVEEVAERTWAVISLSREADARARAEASRQHAEERYQSLFDTIGEGLAIIELIRDAAGQVVDVVYREVNDAFERHTGWQNARGRRRSEIAPIPDDDWLAGADRIVQTGQPERWEAYSRNARRWYRCFLSRVGGEGSQVVLLVFENITGRKNHERNRALLTTITDDLAGFENIPETLAKLCEKIARHFDVPWCAITSPGPDFESSGVFHGWNAPDASSFAEPLRPRDLLAGEFLAIGAEPPAAGEPGEPLVAREPTVVADSQNDERVLAERCAALGIRSFVIVPLVRHGVSRFLLSIFDRHVRSWRDDEIELLRELTQRIWARLERTQAEEALRHSEAQLRTLAAELQEADRRKNDFLAMLGHELRNPLAAIRGGVQLLRSEKARPESRAAALPIVAEQVTHMERLVDDLLDLTRIVQGRVQLRRERIALQDALRQALEMVRPQSEPEGFVIDVTTPSESLEVLGDRVRLTQVFMNVLGNAVKYSGDSRLIEVVAERDGDHAVVRIRDRGLGIPPEVLPRIFDPFVQANPGRTLQAGLGLGLAVVRQLMLLHDGEVEALSGGDREGSEFVLRLPLLAS